MFKFLLRFAIFIICGLVLAEIIVRAGKLVADVPARYVDNHGIQRYNPGQSGYYKSADLRWEINRLGFVGPLKVQAGKPTVALIGDSFIENFMNPEKCRQSTRLASLMPDYNFIEAARSGVTAIEALEMTKSLDNINISYNILYLSDGDFLESLPSLGLYTDRMQYFPESDSISKPQVKSAFIKTILYNWKFSYYLYNRFPLFVNAQDKGEAEVSQKAADKIAKALPELGKLFQYMAAHYDTRLIGIAFHPGTDARIIELAQKARFRVIALQNANDRDWTFGYDSHWTCYGHERAAEQVGQFVNRELAFLLKDLDSKKMAGK